MSPNNSNFLTPPLFFHPPAGGQGQASKWLTLQLWNGLFWSLPGVEMKP